MHIGGLQKTSLVDFPGKLACTVFTSGCNLRCPFCHNASLVVSIQEESEITEDEFFSFLNKRNTILDGVCVSGGEPLLHPDLPQFLERIRGMGLQVKLDTNGGFFDRLNTVIEAHLVDYVAMDIKGAPAQYAEVSGQPELNLRSFEQSKDLLLSGIIDYEFRTTVVKGLHTLEGMRNAAKWIEGAERYFIQNYENSGAVICPDGLDGFTSEEMQDFLATIKPFVNSAAIRGV